jgi:hypothetical protein
MDIEPAARPVPPPNPADAQVASTGVVLPAGGCGQLPMGCVSKCCVVVPDAVATCAELSWAEPGHHATSHPFWIVARTCEPSLRTSAAAVTPAPAWPSTNE